MIKVVQLTENPIAGAPINLNNVLNKYQSEKVSSRHIASSDRNENRVFHSDIIIGKNSYEEIRQVLQECDVVHMHNFYKEQELFRRHPELWPIVMRKKRIVQFHTQRDIAWVNLEAGLEDKHAKHLVIAQYHPRQYPECEVVPNVIDIYSPEYTPDFTTKRDLPRVVFSPSRIGFKGWDNKGYHETVPTLQKLVNERIITANVIYNRPHAECLSERRKADISIDEIVTGSYHLVSLESLAAGLVTIAGLDQLQVKTLRDLTGSENLPWVTANSPKSLEFHLRMFTDQDFLLEQRKYSRAWMEEFWSPQVLSDKFVKIYEGL